jgi:GH15 family glucan-1,4-alpha-glucosidase
MSFRRFLVYGTLDDAERADPEALVEAPSERPVEPVDVDLDRRLLPVIRSGADWQMLLRTVEADEALPEARLLRWLGDALHYQLVETDPTDASAWRLTEAGAHRLKDLRSRPASSGTGEQLSDAGGATAALRRTDAETERTRRLDTDTSSLRVESRPVDAPLSAVRGPMPKIADYAFLSNCHTGALVAPNGAVDWLCVPRFDSPSVFGSLLDRGAGTFRLGPFGINHPSGRVYEPGTNTLLTSWKTPTGWATVREALTMGPHRGEDRIRPHTRPLADQDAEHTLVRSVACVEGSVEIELVCEPAFDYGRVPAEWSLTEDRHRADATGAGQAIRLETDMLIGMEDRRVRARHVLSAGDELYCALSWDEGASVPTNVEQANAQLSATTHFWHDWLGQARIPDHELRPLIERSALAIKGLTYMPTGATVAALTTSLPETPGGERNWDYRYTWIRDSTFTLQALHFLNLDWEANEFMAFITDLERNDDGGLQAVYGIDGRRDLSESVHEDLWGYDGARPVRIGNAAFDQRQNDVFGAALDSVLSHTRRDKRLPRRLWPLVQSQAECATAVWRQPDQGIWEARGKPQHYVSSKLMCWVALDRASKLATIRGDAALQATWAKTATEIKADILEHGLDKRGVLTQHYNTDALDASTLLAALFGFLLPGDERLHASVLAIADELTEDGFVLRYRTDQTDDGLSGKEGTFVACSFWLVSALTIIGENAQARGLMERLARVASPLGLFAEELDAATYRHLGNFPQAFSHVALVEAAGRIILADLLDEDNGEQPRSNPLARPSPKDARIVVEH